MAGRRGMLKRKPNFTLQELDILMSEVLRYEPLLFGAASAGVNAYEKQKIWWRITSQINAAGRNQRDIGEVKNRWRGLRRRAKGETARPRPPRPGPPHAGRPQGAPRPPAGGAGASEPPGRPALGPEGGRHGVRPLDAPPPQPPPPPPPPGNVEVAAGQGVKEEPVKQELADVKSEPFHPVSTEAIQQRVTRGAEKRLLRSSGCAPGDLCEGQNRSPPKSSLTKLSLSEPGGQQEALASDYASTTLDQQSPCRHLNNCILEDMVAPMTLPGQEGLPESCYLSPVERRIAQSNEQLAQEVRAFRQEYAKCHRETSSILHSIVEALSGVSSSLAEIRDLYLRQQEAPKL